MLGINYLSAVSNIACCVYSLASDPDDLTAPNIIHSISVVNLCLSTFQMFSGFCIKYALQRKTTKDPIIGISTAGSGFFCIASNITGLAARKVQDYINARLGLNCVSCVFSTISTIAMVKKRFASDRFHSDNQSIVKNSLSSVKPPLYGATKV